MNYRDIGRNSQEPPEPRGERYYTAVVKYYLTDCPGYRDSTRVEVPVYIKDTEEEEAYIQKQVQSKSPDRVVVMWYYV